MKVENNSSASKRLEEFKKEHGRPPRILHIGNIANNAYNNAKLLNEAGLDCDVICYDYYHIMGCPEWEDADFDGSVKDQFFPNWRSLDLNGFKRPKWFAQGPLKFCLRYLIAKRDKKKVASKFWWNVLEVNRFLLCSPIGIAIRHCLLVIRHCLLVIRHCLLVIRHKWFPLGKAILYFIATIGNFFLFIFYFLIAFLVLPAKILRKVYGFLIPYAEQKIGTFIFDEQVSKLIEIFEKEFPGRSDKLTKNDLEGYKNDMPCWRKLFSRYDIIQAYSTDGIWPLLAGKMPYCCLEHGTLRTIPFASDAQGRRTSLCYKMADHVFVTNADCLDNAYSLKNKEYVSFINHPYDEDHGVNRRGWKKMRQRLIDDLDSDFLFFFPTRHDWIHGTGYADKANDIFLRAFVTLRRRGYRVGMICCKWGKNIRQSRNILESNGCAAHIFWKDPMGTILFERTALACHVVVDQFLLGSFGGILFKTMAVGAPVCTYLDENEMLAQYGEIPPVINCRTEDDIVAVMEEIIAKPSLLTERADRSRDWIKKYYNSSDTINLQLEVYKDQLAKMERHDALSKRITLNE